MQQHNNTILNYFKTSSHYENKTWIVLLNLLAVTSFSGISQSLLVQILKRSGVPENSDIIYPKKYACNIVITLQKLVEHEWLSFVLVITDECHVNRKRSFCDGLPGERNRLRRLKTANEIQRISSSYTHPDGRMGF